MLNIFTKGAYILTAFALAITMSIGVIKNFDFDTETFEIRTNESIIITKSNSECGEACDINAENFKMSQGLNYPLLHKSFHCGFLMQRLFLERPAKQWPPPREPPPSLLDEFTMHGAMPVLKYRYFAQKRKNSRHYFNVEFISKLQKKALKGENVSSYGMKGFKLLTEALNVFREVIESKDVLVIGTVKPWVEALLLNANVGHITTIDYNEDTSTHPNITLIAPWKLAAQYLHEPKPLFDFGVSYSSLEHSGLGRYGDNLNPAGDLEAMAQAWCLIKPKGIFILNVEHDKGKNYLVWNAHRVYGDERLKHLTANWNVTTLLQEERHVLRIMQKVE